jgi:hypothetical protein
MSIISQVEKKFGIAPSETDKADITPSVSIVSLQNQESQKLLSEFEPHEHEAAMALLKTIHELERGEIPAHYTATTTCRYCGPVPIFEGVPDQVLGCPWCFVGGPPK